MHGYCFVTTKQAIDGVLAQTPAKKTAMFRVVSISSKAPDDILGEHVYVKNDEVFDFMSNRRIEGITAEDLMFISYV